MLKIGDFGLARKVRRTLGNISTSNLEKLKNHSPKRCHQFKKGLQRNSNFSILTTDIGTATYLSPE